MTNKLNFPAPELIPGDIVSMNFNIPKATRIGLILKADPIHDGTVFFTYDYLIGYIAETQIFARIRRTGASLTKLNV